MSEVDFKAARRHINYWLKKKFSSQWYILLQNERWFAFTKKTGEMMAIGHYHTKEEALKAKGFTRKKWTWEIYPENSGKCNLCEMETPEVMYITRKLLEL